MEIKISKIMDEYSKWGLFESQQGPDKVITGMPDVRKCGEGDLVFVDSEEFVNCVQNNKPSAVITTQKLAGHFKETANTSVLISSNVKLAQALMRQAYVDRDFRDNHWPRIHDYAVIHETATIPEDVTIGPGVIVSKNVNIGSNTVILANTVIEEDVKIGSDTVIHPNVTIAYQSIIGDRCIIKSGTVIGMEGFGFAQDSEQKSFRVPQLGKVVIGNDVVLGANCTIDRATFAETKIMDGCKLDAQVHIAHNVELGEDGLIVAQCGIAGSTKIGKRFRCSGQAGILDHIEICDDVTLVHRPGVIQDVNVPGAYGGLPLQPLRKHLKSLAIITQLEELKKTLEALLNKLK